MKRGRPILDAQPLIALVPELSASNDHWTAQGYVLKSGRIWQVGNGRWAARLVWRQRRSSLCTIAVTVQNIGSFVARAVSA